MMRTTLLAAVAAFSMITVAAHAESEGGGDPFPFGVPGVTTAPTRAYADTGSANYPDLRGRPAHVAAADDLEAQPINGSEGVVQTAASLPPGFSNGTVSNAQAQSVARSLAARGGHLRLAAPGLAGAHRG